ncbi:hypothetical protein Q3G72_002925 [Acer saccharum]|nr:hypothetical protein Q3G72_002925 [Acer saccharum]
MHHSSSLKQIASNGVGLYSHEEHIFTQELYSLRRGNPVWWQRKAGRVEEEGGGRRRVYFVAIDGGERVNIEGNKNGGEFRDNATDDGV